MDFLLKSSAIIGIFFICYKVFLQRDTFFESNRWFLLLGLLIASCISFLVIPNYIEYTPIDYSQFEVITKNHTDQHIEESGFNNTQPLTWIYITGLLFYFGKLVVEFLSLKKILSTSQIKTSKNFKFVETTEQISPFSFFNYIVYNPIQFNKKELQHVINHEKVHADQLHSIDIILAQLICVLLWFNPLSWLYKKAIQQNLEFIADQKAIDISACEKSYQALLLKVSLKNNQLAVTNNFYTSLIKKRILMLHKLKSKPFNQLKLALVLPILMLFLMSFNTKDIHVESTSNTQSEPQQFNDQNESIEIVITKNTSDANLEAIKNELKTIGIAFSYDVIKRNSDGEIIAINTTFESDKKSTNYNILEEDGIKPFRFKSSADTFSVGSLNNTINSYIYKVFDEDSIKIQSSTSSKKMVFVEEFNMDNSPVFIEDTSEPIFIINGKIVNKSKFKDVDSENILSVFILDDEKAKNKFGKEGENGAIIMTKKNSKLTVDTDGKEPLFIINGKVMSKEEINSVEPNKIESIEVFKDKEAQQLYGDKGKNGVIVLNLTQPSALKNQNKNINFDTNLYILDGKEISKSDLENIYSKETVSSLVVLNSKEAIEKYGDKGKNGAVEVITKKNDKDSKSNGKTVVFSSEEDSNHGNPWKIETEIVSYHYIEGENEVGAFNNKKETIEFVISKDVSDDFLEKQKDNLQKHGIDVKFSKIRRNKVNEITSIKITLDDHKGRTTSASWKEKDQTIPDIIMGKSNDDKLYIRAIGN